MWSRGSININKCKYVDKYYLGVFKSKVNRYLLNINATSMTLSISKIGTGEKLGYT